jgi:hypothetical protein
MGVVRLMVYVAPLTIMVTSIARLPQAITAANFCYAAGLGRWPGPAQAALQAPLG